MSDPHDRLHQLIHEAGGRILEVGGCVRDELRGAPPKDRDYLVCGLDPERIKTLLKPHGRVDVVGQSFGVLKFTPRGMRDAIDLSLPRREVSTGAGHRDFLVDADPHLPVEVDLGRRDFTINAMARDCHTGELIDPFGGKRDLENRVLRVVSERAFEEDPLRMLRGAQFAARLDLEPDPDTIEHMQRHAALIATVSPERIALEIVKGLKAKAPSTMFRLLARPGLLRYALPELDRLRGLPVLESSIDAFEHSIRTCDHMPFPETDRAPLRLAAAFHALGRGADPGAPHAAESARIATDLLERVRFSAAGENVDVARITHLIREQELDCPPRSGAAAIGWDRLARRFASRVGPQHALDLAGLRLARMRACEQPSLIVPWDEFYSELRELLAARPPLIVKDLAVNGRDLIASGVKPGPGMGKLLERLLDAVLDDPGRNTREALLALAKDLS